MNTLPTLDGDTPLVPANQVLKRGERLLEPDVYRIQFEGRPAVVKDYRRYQGTPLSPVARLLVRHEAKVLSRLQGWKHAPALLGTLGGLVLGMEYIPGDTLTASVQGVSQEVFDQLQGALARLHAAGITHNDLHGTNVMVSAGVPVLLDFTSALRWPRWLRNSPITRQLRRSDMKNLVKMRQRLTGQRPSAEQAALLAEPGWVQGLRRTWKRLYRWIKRQD